MNNDDIDTGESRVLIDNPDRPSHSYLPDWVLMSDASMRAKLYYWSLRSWIFEKDPEYVVSITDPQVAEFMGCSVRTAERARLDATEAGLIQVSREYKPYAYVNGRPKEQPMVRTIAITLDPPNGVTAVNSVLERRRIQEHHGAAGPPSKQRAKTTSEPASEGPQKCGPGDDLGNVDKNPGRTLPDGGGSADLSERPTDLSDAPTKLSDAPTDLSENAPSDQGEQGPQDEEWKTNLEDEGDEHLEPFGDAQKVPDLQKAYGETAGHSASGVPMQGDQVGESLPLRARARFKAGEAACQAIDQDSLITQAELAEVIRRDQPGLSHGQVVGRAAMLISHSPKGPSAHPEAS